MAVNRTDLVDAVARAAGLERRQSDAAIAALIDIVVGEVSAGHKVNIFGLGTFNRTSRNARMGRNPQTGEPVPIPASKGIRFVPATAFRVAMNPGQAKKSANKSSAKKGAAKTAAKATKSTKTARKR